MHERQGAHAATTPEIVPPQPAPPVGSPEGPPQFPEGPRASQGFDPVHEKLWNIVADGAAPYNGSAPVRSPIHVCLDMCAPFSFA